jgi:NAD(P)H dehydrogenase (quinone)
MSKILITGATGHLGKGTIEFLLKKGVEAKQISALVRDEGKADELKELGINLITGDYNNYESLIHAFNGVEKLLFVSSSDVPNRTHQHENVVNAAKQKGVGHIIYTSALNNTTMEKSAIAFVAEAHVKTEEWIKESGLTYTLLRNNLYMDIIPQFIGDVLQTGTIYLAAGDGKTAFTLRSEMAEAAANVIISSDHEGKSYDITNLQTYTYQDIADEITEISGKKIIYVSPSADEFSATLKNAGVPEEMIGGFTAFAIAQSQNEFNVTGDSLEKILGRKPTTLKEYLTAIYGNKD